MTLQDTIEKHLIEESIKQVLPYEMIKCYAERGSQIVFNKSLYDLVESFRFSEEEDSLKINLMNVCIEGGILHAKINSSKD